MGHSNVERAGNGGVHDVDPEVRAAMSVFAQAPDPDRVDSSLARLEADLASGLWDKRHGDLRATRELDVGYRLVVADI